MDKKKILSVLFCLFLVTTNAQVNLVPNSSFETYTTCPDDLAEINYTGNWYMPTPATSDFFHTCAVATLTYNSVWVPNNYFGYQQPYNNGNGYAGVVAYEGPNSNGWKEYIQTPLSSVLVAGQTYYCSFYVSLANLSRYATDVISAYFSQSAISSTATTHFTVTPQVSSPSGIFLNDTLNWRPVSGSFIASGGEQYITIGVFKNASNTSNIPTQVVTQQPVAYYYIDQVCLSTSSVICKADANVGIHEPILPEELFYYSQPSKKLIFKEPMQGVVLTIMDLNGKQLRIDRLNQRDVIDLSELGPGCYFVFITSSANRQVKKIVIE